MSQRYAFRLADGSGNQYAGSLLVCDLEEARLGFAAAGFQVLKLCPVGAWKVPARSQLPPLPVPPLTSGRLRKGPAVQLTEPPAAWIEPRQPLSARLIYLVALAALAGGLLLGTRLSHSDSVPHAHYQAVRRY